LIWKIWLSLHIFILRIILIILCHMRSTLKCKWIRYMQFERVFDRHLFSFFWKQILANTIFLPSCNFGKYSHHRILWFFFVIINIFFFSMCFLIVYRPRSYLLSLHNIIKQIIIPIQFWSNLYFATNLALFYTEHSKTTSKSFHIDDSQNIKSWLFLQIKQCFKSFNSSMN